MLLSPAVLWLIQLCCFVASPALSLLCDQVKPALPYLDVIMALRQNSTVPIAAYHVSGEPTPHSLCIQVWLDGIGEYAMIKAAALNGWVDERSIVMEQLMSIRRAGADIIFTYYARQAAQWLAESTPQSSFQMAF